MKGYTVALLVMISYGTTRINGSMCYTAVFNNTWDSKVFYINENMIDKDMADVSETQTLQIGDTLHIPNSVWLDSKDTLSLKKSLNVNIF